VPKILIYSDLHLEFAAFTPSIELDFDIVVLAGDIHAPGVDAVHWAQRQPAFADRPVIYVAGNHEYYRQDWQEQLQKMREQAHGSQVHVLERDEVVIEGIRFLGTTLWTDFALYQAQGLSAEQAAHTAQRYMNDFSLISHRLHGASERSRFSAADSTRQHQHSRAWLLKHLADTSQHMPTVVVTHHAPTAQSIAPQYLGDALSPAFASNLPAECFETPLLWIHGHTHSSFDYTVGRTRVICNPRGYSSPRQAEVAENEAFDPALVVELVG
jgi:predicted phosphodiesterase